MRLGVISDLHIDNNSAAIVNGQSFESALSNVVKHYQFDYLLIVGDISNHYQVTQQFIEDIEMDTGIPIYFVPGNHDYWAFDHDIKDTRRLHEFFKNQKQSLIDQPVILNKDWALVGNPGWYDFGYGDHSKYSDEFFERKRYKIAYWNDAKYVDWGMDDKRVSRWMQESIERDIEKVANKKIILMTHVAVHPLFVPPLPHRIYDFANAYLGAKSYEKLFEKYPQIKYSLMGHVHHSYTLTDNGTTYMMACLGNYKHWINKDCIEREIERVIRYIDI